MRLTLALCTLLLACGGKAGPTIEAARTVDSDPNQQPNHRLGEASRPTAYALHMQMDPTRGAFRGEIDIDIEVAQPLHTLWLHQRDLIIESATLERAGKLQTLRVQVPEDDDEVELFSLHADAPLAAGPARLHIEFKAHFGNVSGLFRQSEEGRWYAYSDFEATDARSAFPCYDDPRFKVPWRIRIDVPAGDMALSNAPQESREMLANGQERFVFATTRPLPSYLVAMASGPFDAIAGKASSTPVRVIAPRGQAERGRFVLDNSDAWLRFLESYLGMSMPYPKLDFIAVPHFSGAMENPGLITFSSDILLTGDHASDALLRVAAGVTTHELAHMWFGDLLTPRYWNDLWLNEGFATWLSDKNMAAYQPHRAREILDIADKSSAFVIDHGLHGRKLREPIEASKDIRSAFSAITYRKGGSVLTMLEAWIGESAMQEAVRAYASTFVDGSVSSEDLLGSLLSSTRNRQVVPFLHGFLEQSGIPQVRFELDCSATPTLRVSQKRYLPVTSSAQPAPRDLDRLWTLPLCFRYGTDSQSQRECKLLTSKSARFELPGECPSWIQPNDGESGYYHSLLPPSLFAALAERPLDPRELQGQVYNLVGAVESGDLSLAEALPLLKAHAQSSSGALQEALLPFLYQLSVALRSQEQRDEFAALIRQWYGPRARQLGFDPRPGESQDDRDMRPAMLRLVAGLGEDAELRTLAAARVDELLARRHDLGFDLLSAVLEIAAIDGDAERWQQYQDAVERARDRRMRALVLGAMHAFADPTLFGKSLELSLSADQRPANLYPILVRAAADPNRAELLWDALAVHRDALLSQEEGQALDEMLTQLSAGACSSAAIEHIKGLAADELDVGELVERVAGCIAYADVLANNKSLAASE